MYKDFFLLLNVSFVGNFFEPGLERWWVFSEDGALYAIAFRDKKPPLVFL